MAQFIGESTDKMGIGFKSNGFSNFIDTLSFLQKGASYL